MFARTQRLLLRPGFPEDALVVAEFGREAPDFFAEARDPLLPALLIFERTEGEPRLVGACRLRRRSSGRVELGCWIARARRRRGFATEACAALLDIARTLRLTTVEASPFLDDTASVRLLDKLGFVATGLVARRRRANGAQAPARIMRLDVAAAARERESALAA